MDGEEAGDDLTDPVDTDGDNTPDMLDDDADADSFSAVLELAKRGEIELRQDRTFAPLYLRSRNATENPA